MRNKLVMVMLSAMLVASLALTACVEPVTPPVEPVEPVEPTPAPEVIKWRMSSTSSLEDIKGKQVKIFCDLVEKNTDGRLQITLYPGGTLLSAPEAAKELIRGNLALDYGPFYFYEGLIPAMCIGTLPFLGVEGTDYREILKPGTRGREIIDEILALYNVKLLCLWDIGGIGLASYESLATVEDFSGKIIRVSGIALKLLGVLDAEALYMPGVEAVDAMRRGMLDASIIEPSGLKPRGYVEFAPYWTNWNMAPVPCGTYVSLDAWNELPPDIQAIVWETAQEHEEIADKTILDYQVVALDEAVSVYGMEVIEVTPEELARMREIMLPILREEVAKAEPSDLVMELFEIIVEYVEKK